MWKYQCIALISFEFCNWNLEGKKGTDIDHDFSVFEEYLLQPSGVDSLGRTDILLDHPGV